MHTTTTVTYEALKSLVAAERNASVAKRQASQNGRGYAVAASAHAHAARLLEKARKEYLAGLRP